MTVSIDVSEKLAPQAGMKTSFSIGKDLRTGELFAEEYGRQVKGQMNINDYAVEKVDGQVVDTSTGEIIGDNTGNKVLDFRKVQSL